ncbi:hypothetical protein JCM31826_12050 [Thermaurantimonas aggregans]|uniref:Uncharacterized protein n=1 Tax=Thermaurantimonas aggregans TaxID=2173829 RepID=A0A401XL49_9FLAO|nr:hypothetical protein [Thermaurantimonas aggregans]MCX8149709.1 hypothetical protein [Thermaurantimonas aggregans]GCD77723.1 hypothetical protein JCM31826_12050 [Thermaurantimonas aggregans]
MIKTWHYKLLGAIVGLIGGLVYYYKVGCMGSCAIWSNPFISAGYGSLLGYLGISMFVDSKKEPSKNDSSQS